jgi:hypothetical protein
MSLINRYLLWVSCLILSACTPASIPPLTVSDPAHPEALAGIAPPRSRTLDVNKDEEIKEAKPAPASRGHDMRHGNGEMNERTDQLKSDSMEGEHHAH